MWIVSKTSKNHGALIQYAVKSRREGVDQLFKWGAPKEICAEILEECSSTWAGATMVPLNNGHCGHLKYFE